MPTPELRVLDRLRDHNRDFLVRSVAAVRGLPKDIQSKGYPMSQNPSGIRLVLLCGNLASGQCKIPEATPIAVPELTQDTG
jgi:hypothetical protein